jgi:hypothetical protein
MATSLASDTLFDATGGVTTGFGAAGGGGGVTGFGAGVLTILLASSFIFFSAIAAELLAVTTFAGAGGGVDGFAGAGAGFTGAGAGFGAGLGAGFDVVDLTVVSLPCAMCSSLIYIFNH